MFNIVTINDGTNVVISWDEPTDNYSPVLEYLIDIRANDYEFKPITECDGTNPSIRTCTVSILTLRNAPFSLTYGMLVAARVKARNAYGWSIEAEPNTVGAIIQIEP